MNATAKQQPSYLGQDINDGSLRIINCVGSGSYGAVYLAHVLDSAGVDTGRELAIKVIPKPTATSHHGRSRARRIHGEIMLHQRVRSHPNVTTIRDVFQDAHSVFLTLDYHSGGDLYDFLAEANTIRRLRATDRPAAADLVRDIFVQVVDAVMHCHAHGVFHRDIKPENILVGADGKVHLADFGLATMQALCTELGCGSPFFMAPEVFIQPGSDKRPYSARHADIWSLGVLLANLLTTSRPWEFAGPDDGDYYEYLGTLPAADVALHMNVRVIPPEDPELAASRVGALRGLSAEASVLLRAMFQLEPRKRIPLAEVRRRVLDVRAWWKEDEEQVAEIDAEMERMVDCLVDDDDMPGPPHTESGEGVRTEADVDEHPDVPRSLSPTSPVHDPTPIPAHLAVTVRHRVYYSRHGSSSSMAYETVFEDHAPNADRVGLYVVNGSVSSDSDEEWDAQCDYDSDEEDVWREGPNDVIVLDQSVFEEAASSESDDSSATHTPATLPVDVEGTIASVPAMDLENWDDQTTDSAVDKNWTERGPVRMVGADGRSIDVALV